MEGLPLIDWLLSPIDISRTHQLGAVESWHARLMVLSWGLMVPVGVLAARFLKIMPGQKWPQELDNRTWWHAHLFLQWGGALLSCFGIAIIVRKLGEVSFFETPHHTLGWITLALMLLQIIAGLFRGSKGGPTYPAPDGSWRGDHYDMTLRRKIFEYSHKSLGYVALVCAALAILFGLNSVNAPIWIWGGILLWWSLLIVIALVLQIKLGAIDTYQAIWGPDPTLPGNQTRPIGLGIKRPPPER